MRQMNFNFMIRVRAERRAFRGHTHPGLIGKFKTIAAVYRTSREKKKT